MSDKMTPIRFQSLINRIFNEYSKSKSIFGIKHTEFFKTNGENFISMFRSKAESPMGPAAGPHTQLTQNIIASYLTGGRFFELKTVQILDKLLIDKPCIDVQDEGYNVEWSQELKLTESFDEYLKAWLLLPIIKIIFGISPRKENDFIFNMSVGYDLKGIKSAPMDQFIENMKDASKSASYNHYKDILTANIYQGTICRFLQTNAPHIKPKALLRVVEEIQPELTNSITLSTMHGCPPEEIEAISNYLLEKNINTYVKLNPTLLGFNRVSEILKLTGYKEVVINPESFSHDISYEDAIPMLKRLIKKAKELGKEFGVKLSNTLGVQNGFERLPGKEMYMSGRSLFPLTINLASMLADEFEGNLSISYSGGADITNVESIFDCGIFPVTIATDLLKPGGYGRMKKMCELIDAKSFNAVRDVMPINTTKLKELANDSLTNKHYKKETREIETVKVPSHLPIYDCFVAPCEVACPIHQDVSDYVRLIEEKRYAEAFEVTLSKNPLPFITGYICDHQCQFKCTRWDYDDPIEIRHLKLVAAENGSAQYLEKFNIEYSIKKNDIKVAVIGAGPAGLSAGFFLAKNGFDVTILEKNSKPGGTVDEIIPRFRIPDEAINSDISLIEKHGVKFEFNCKKDFSFDSLKKEGYKYIFIGIGAQKPKVFDLTGDNKNIIDALDFLKAFKENHPIHIGKKVAVVGGGDTAMDGARSAKRLPGVESVYIVYRRTKEFMPAEKDEFEAADREGIILKELILPCDFSGNTLKCSKMKLTEKEADGRKKVVILENEFEYLDIDTVIMAIGEDTDYEILQNNGLEIDSKGDIKLSNSGNETTIENVFIGGDAMRGPSTIIESIADGKKSAEYIIKKEQLLSQENIFFNTSIPLGKRLEDLDKRKLEILPVEKSDHLLEAHRCLNCTVICNKCVEVCPNRSNVAYTFNESNLKDINQIIHLDALCNECGNCFTFCPHSEGSPYFDKLTVFASEKDFMESKNPGFFFVPENKKMKITMRINNVIDAILFDSEMPDIDLQKYDEATQRAFKIAIDIYSNCNYLLQY